jgi:hypothetical protein
MKITGLVFIFYTILNLNNIVNTQPTISYKESNNVTSSKEYVNNHHPPQPPHHEAPYPVPTPFPTSITPPCCCNYPPPTTPPLIAIPIPIPSPPINSIYLTPTCQNMF